MPPATSIVLVRSLGLDLRRISNPFHQQSKREEVPPEPTMISPETTGEDTKTDTTAETFTPYSPPPSLHAAALPPTNALEPSGSGPGSSDHHSSHSHPTREIIAIAVPLAFASLLCIILVLSWLKSKKFKTALKRVFAKANFFRQPARMESLTRPEDLIIDICVKTPSTDERAQDGVDLDSESEKSDELEGSIETEISEGPVPPRHVPPSISSRESAMLGDDDCGILNMTAFWSRMEAEEANVCLATSIALAGSGSEINSMAHSLATGSSLNIRYRTRQDSDASESTQETTRSNIFSTNTTSCSSKTSFRRGGDSQEDMEIEDDLHTEETAFELARAQTQSVEIKRGVLINWGGEFGGNSCGKYGGSTLPSVVVTCPSSLSSISVDLDEFPQPPDDFMYIKT